MNGLFYFTSPLAPLHFGEGNNSRRLNFWKWLSNSTKFLLLINA